MFPDPRIDRNADSQRLQLFDVQYTNPYSPTELTHRERDSTPEPPESVWVRNLKAMVAVVTAYSMLCAVYAILGRAMPESIVVVLLVVGSIASAWANLTLGPRIGWDRGGLPVAFVVFFLALTAYLGCALVAGGMLYGALNPVTIYTPMRVDPDTI